MYKIELTVQEPQGFNAEKRYPNMTETLDALSAHFPKLVFTRGNDVTRVWRDEGMRGFGDDAALALITYERPTSLVESLETALPMVLASEMEVHELRKVLRRYDVMLTSRTLGPVHQAMFYTLQGNILVAFAEDKEWNTALNKAFIELESKYSHAESRFNQTA